MPATPTSAPRRFTLPEHVLLLCIALTYILLIGRYRAYDLDDVWFLSFSHGAWVSHVSTDTFMLQSFPAGMGGTVAFGRLAALLQGAVLSHLGWTLVSAILLSILFVLAALLLLADLCRRLALPPHFTLCYIALLGLTEPFVFAAEKARYEFLPLFLLALALNLALRNFTVLAFFLAALATEIEPAAIVIPCAVLATILHLRPEPLRRLLPRLALAATLAIALYFFLHPDILSIFRTAHWGGVSTAAFPGGFVTAYYLRYKRHLLDLALLLVALAVALRSRRHLFTDWPALCCLTILAISTLLRWGNTPYFVFLSPFLCLFLLQSLFVERHWKLFLAAILLWTIPQYAYRFHFWSARNAGFTQQDLRQVTAAVESASSTVGKPSSEIVVMGNFNLWYAHPTHFINLDRRLLDRIPTSNPDLFLCFNQPTDPILPPQENYEVPCSTLEPFTHPLHTIDLHGHILQLRTPNTR